MGAAALGDRAFGGTSRELPLGASSSRRSGGPDHTSIRPAMLALNTAAEAGVDGASAPDLRRDLGGEIRLVLLDALAEGEADEFGDLDRRADLLCRRLDDLGDARLAVDDEDLLEQDDF